MDKQMLDFEMRGTEAFFRHVAAIFEESEAGYAPHTDAMTVAQQIAHAAQTVEWFLHGATRPEGFDLNFDEHLREVHERKLGPRHEAEGLRRQEAAVARFAVDHVADQADGQRSSRRRHECSRAPLIGRQIVLVDSVYRSFAGDVAADHINFAMGGGGASIIVWLGRTASAYDLRSDWTLVHEMAHLGLPNLPRRQRWIEEGLATYVEPMARVRLGLTRPEDFWGEMVRGLPRGRLRPGKEGFDDAGRWGTTYWGGALFWFLADIEIRKRTQNKFGLEHALRGPRLSPRRRRGLLHRPRLLDRRPPRLPGRLPRRACGRRAYAWRCAACPRRTRSGTRASTGAPISSSCE